MSDAEGVKTAQTVGLRFGFGGKTYCFRAEGLELRKGDRVVVESDLGISIGDVVSSDFPIPAEKEIKPVLRKVTQADLKQEEENEEVRQEAFRYCNERIEARGLQMKLLSTEVTLDRKRFLFYFTAESRIDFRELVKDLASKYRTRIELRQIGVRDAAKLVGGLGVCGREFCCRSFLQGFAPISIKMAKQQDLVLNTCKLSGTCGRLMCCLHFEYEPGKKGKRSRDERKVESREPFREAVDSAECAEKATAPEGEKLVVVAQSDVLSEEQLVQDKAVIKDQVPPAAVVEGDKTVLAEEPEKEKAEVQAAQTVPEEAKAEPPEGRRHGKKRRYRGPRRRKRNKKKAQGHGGAGGGSPEKSGNDNPG